MPWTTYDEWQAEQNRCRACDEPEVGDKQCPNCGAVDGVYPWDVEEGGGPI